MLREICCGLFIPTNDKDWVTPKGKPMPFDVTQNKEGGRIEAGGSNEPDQEEARNVGIPYEYMGKRRTRGPACRSTTNFPFAGLLELS